MKNKFGKDLFLLLIIFIIIISFFNFLHLNTGIRETEITYTQFLRMVENHQIKKVTIKENFISGKINETTLFKTFTPNDPELIKILRKNGVEIEVHQKSSPWLTNLLGTFLPILIR